MYSAAFCGNRHRRFHEHAEQHQRTRRREHCAEDQDQDDDNTTTHGEIMHKGKGPRLDL
jgi:hypothetical protein